MIWLNQLVQGLMLGGYYALLACGLSFMFGVMGIINLAHGSLAVLAAYMLFVLAERFEVHPLLGLVAVIPVMALIGWVLHRLVLERSARAGALIPLLSTFGLASVLDNSLIVYGSPMGNPNVHNHKRCPLFFAGHAGGRLKGNVHIKAPDGTPMANAMLAGLRGIGLGIDTFGDSTGPLDLNAVTA